MGRRAWIKLWVEPWLEDNPDGIRIRNLPIAVRGTFATLLALAGDSMYAEQGVVSFAPGCGYSDEQIAHKLNIDVRTWASHKELLKDAPFIEVSQHNEITIVNWEKYQPDYRKKKKSNSNSKTKSEFDSNSDSKKKSIPIKKEKEKEKKKEKDKGIKHSHAIVDNSSTKDCLAELHRVLGEDTKPFAPLYRKAIDALGPDTVYRCLAETKLAMHEERIKTSPGAFFSGLLRVALLEGRQ